MIRQVHPKRGFTLLEALVAVSILMVAVAAPMTIAQKGLSSASYSKNQMIASYLAQDAIEYIKNKRDENVINKREWLDRLEDCSNTTGCQIDTITSVISPYSGSNHLQQDVTNKFYGYALGGTDTGFTRKVEIQENNENEVLLIVTVSWGADKVTVKSLMYNY